jgi:hypothetical protein
MRLFKFLLAGALLAAATTANAQVNSSSLLMPAAADPSAAVSAVPAPDPAALPAAPTPSADSGPAAVPLSAEPAPASRLSAAPAQRGPVPVVDVFEHYNFQISVGYTFVRFYEAPHQIQNRNGFNSNLIYYYHGGWIGIDGSLLGGFGSQSNSRSRFLFLGAGPRFRWAGDRAVEFWGHALVGGSHYTPQTSFGKQNAFGYEAGLGADVNIHHSRLAYRAELDMIGTRYFQTYQYSPMASVSIVWKF